MRIAVNTRFLIEGKLEGIGWFTHETMKRITLQHPAHQFFFFFDRPFPQSFIFSDNITPILLPPQARHPVLWYWWFERSIPAVMKQIRPDLFISPDGYLSLNAQVKTLLVIHDIAFEHFDGHVGFLTRQYLRYYSPRFARYADRIATVSQFSKKDISKTYGVDPQKIDVVYNGSRDVFRPATPAEVESVKNKYGIQGDYFIYAGAIQPRKNLANVFRAFDRFRQRNEGEVKLVIAGRKAWKFREALEVYNAMQFRNDVVFTGHLSSSDLSALLSGSLALVYVSLFEGFGLPIVEAMHCGTAVITSNVSSMPEVAADAALLVDPASIVAISDAMGKIYRQPALRNLLIEKGNIRKQAFSWQKTADLLWESAMKVVGLK
ncbi:MAG: glycosyl transferase [Chitinophagales bacterium]|nr:MAG: glycosyl transferase [Chitinophagales bacterium]